MSTTDPDSSPLRSQPALETFIVQPEREKGNDHFSHGQRAVFMALAANLSIGAIKFIAGYVGRQSALMAEAIHSLADAMNSGLLLYGLQKGSRAPDKTHPFGYGLETTLWATVASVAMFVLAIVSFALGVNRYLHPEPTFGYGLQAFVLMASIVLEMGSVNVAAKAVLSEKELVVKGWLRRVREAARNFKTIASPTTRFVFIEDVVALLGAVVALIAITISEVGPIFHIIPQEYAHIPDALASIFIGALLMGLAGYLFLHNSKGLTGTAANPLIEQQIREYVISLHGVSQVHDLRTIDYGLSGIVVHMRIEVNPDIQVKDVDDLTERIRDRLQARIGNIKEVLIEVLADETNMEWSDQFYRLIEQGRDRNVLKPREERILRNVYDFTHAVVRDIMVPRTDVECIEASESINELLDLIITTGHSRIPVYQDDIDNMIGVVHAKEVFEYVRQGRLDVHLSELVKDFEIYPENKPVSDLLEDFKRKKIRIAMVADEHGGFAGIVTIEDLLEEIVGELWDEYDEDEDMLAHLEPNRLILSGRYNIDELNERYALNIPDEEFNTVGGFVFGLLGREPKDGDMVTFEDLTFTILEMDGHRVDKIQIDGPAPFISNMEDEESYTSTAPPTNGTGTTEPS